MMIAIFHKFKKTHFPIDRIFEFVQIVKKSSIYVRLVQFEREASIWSQIVIALIKTINTAVASSCQSCWIEQFRWFCETVTTCMFTYINGLNVVAFYLFQVVLLAQVLIMSPIKWKWAALKCTLHSMPWNWNVLKKKMSFFFELAKGKGSMCQISCSLQLTI